MSADNTAAADVEDYAYYVSDWIWPNQSIGFMKSMLLFFDKITLALPEDLADETINSDPELAVPLAERGLLVNRDPSDILDERTARKLTKALTRVVRKSNWRSSSLPSIPIAALHFGYYGDPDAKTIRDFQGVLEERGLIEAFKGTGLVQLDLRVRLLVLTMFAQVFRSQLLGRGIIVHPLTDSSALARELESTLRFMEIERMPGKVKFSPISKDFMNPRQLSTDLHAVGTDLSDVPLDEILDFRRENKVHYVAYAAGLREFLVTQAALNPVERIKAQQERRLHIQEQAAELRKISRVAFGTRSAALLFALIGAAWTAKHGDIFGSMMAGLTASVQAVPVPEPTVTSYSYILQSKQMS